MLVYYPYVRDLFMLAAAALGIIVVVPSIGLKVTDFHFEGFIVLSALVVAQAAVMVYALPGVVRSWEALP